MTRRYQWSDDDDEIAFDAVTVGIGSDAAAFAAAGMVYGEQRASVMWPDRLHQGDKVVGAGEHCNSVPEALARADEIAALYGFQRVVISIQHRDLWDEAWGELADEPGII